MPLAGPVGLLACFCEHGGKRVFLRISGVRQIGFANLQYPWMPDAVAYQRTMRFLGDASTDWIGIGGPCQRRGYSFNIHVGTGCEESAPKLVEVPLGDDGLGRNIRRRAVA